MPLEINLTVLIGKEDPKPAPRELIEALKSVEVTYSDEGRTGFQLVFQPGRTGRKDTRDYQLVKNPLLTLFNRVILIVTLGATAQVLIDGAITNQQFVPSLEPGNATLTITGEDISVIMDLQEKSVEHTAQDEATIATMILSNYARYGLISRVVQPSLIDRPTRNERIPSQQETDLQYLKTLADRFAFVFYITPGPRSKTSTAYWGPPQRQTQPQTALTVNMGGFSNVNSVSFQHNGLAATTVAGSVQDRRTNQVRPVQESQTDRPPLAARPALTDQAQRRIQQFRETGRDTARADTRAQAMTDRSVDNVVTVSGELDTIRYGALLQLRGPVGLRGVGYSYDGLYYVKTVTHKISQGEYKQSFTITREGLGATIQRVQ